MKKGMKGLNMKNKRTRELRGPVAPQHRAKLSPAERALDDEKARLLAAYTAQLLADDERDEAKRTRNAERAFEALFQRFRTLERAAAKGR